MKVIFKEKIFFDERLTWLFSFFPLIVVIYILVILGIVIKGDISEYTIVMVMAFVFVIYSEVILPFSGALFVFIRTLVRKELIFDSDKLILKSFLSTKELNYLKIKQAKVSIVRTYGNGALKLKIHIISEDFEHKFSLICICAYNELFEEMNKHFLIEVKG